MEASIHRQLVALLRPLGWRLRLRSAVELLAQSAWIALAGCAGVLLVGRLFPLGRYRLVAGGMLAAWLLAWVVYSLARPLRPFTVARRTDGELGLRDRLATALVLTDARYDVPAGFDGALVSRQLEDALAAAQAVEPGRAFPLRLQRHPLMRGAAALLVGVALLLLPNPMDRIVQERAQVAAAARAEAEELEQLAEEVEQNQALTPEDKAALLLEMRELVRQLRANPGDAQKALADLAQFEEQARAALDPAAPAEQAALDVLGAQLAQLAGATESPDLGESAELLEQLAAGLAELSPQQRAALAEALSQAAARTMGGDPDLASALSDLAEAARADPSAADAQSAADRAGQAMRRAAGQLAAQQALGRIANQAGQGQQAIAQAASGDAQQGQGQTAGQDPGQGQGQGQTAGQSQGQGQGQGQTAGQSQGQGQGQPGGGGGTNANSLPPASRSGTAGAPTDPNKPFSVGDLETVYAPIASGQGREEFVSGQQGADGQTTTRENQSPQPGTSGGALVPYSQVYQQYQQIAGQTMERSYIPAGLQEYVKEYFSALEP